MKVSAPFQNEFDAIIALSNGNKQAFDYLFDLYNAKLFIHCFRFVKSKDLADEMVQETFIKIWSFHKSIDPNYSFGAFLFKVAWK